MKVQAETKERTCGPKPSRTSNLCPKNKKCVYACQLTASMPEVLTMMMQNYVSMGVAMIVWLPTKFSSVCSSLGNFHSTSSAADNPRGQGNAV